MLRENIMMTKFAFTNFREGSTVGTRIILMMQWIKLIMAIPLFLILIFFVATHPILFITSTLSGVLVFSSIQMIFYAKKYNFKEALLALRLQYFLYVHAFLDYALCHCNGGKKWLVNKRELPAGILKF